jgi:hypothetical protein
MCNCDNFFRLCPFAHYLQFTMQKQYTKPAMSPSEIRTQNKPFCTWSNCPMLFSVAPWSSRATPMAPPRSTWTLLGVWCQWWTPLGVWCQWWTLLGVWCHQWDRMEREAASKFYHSPNRRILQLVSKIFDVVVVGGYERLAPMRTTQEAWITSRGQTYN